MKCYYEVLGVPRDIESSELRTVFRKLALQCHPDKTGDDGTRFKEVRQAYEVLSNPAERKWYDDHRESILRGANQEDNDDDDDDDEESGSSKSKKKKGTLNLWPFFSSSCYGPGTPGFYAVYEGAFKMIWDDDLKWGSSAARKKSPPSFGDESTPFMPDVKQFYTFWSQFQTTKQFAMGDRWDVSSAPNRQIKRKMEKENQKGRDKLKAEFHSQIQSLVTFVRNRDPRYLKYQAQQAKIADQKQKQQQNSKAKKVENSRGSGGPTVLDAEEIEKLKQAHWESFVEDSAQYLARLEEEFGTEEDDGAEAEELYCIACRRKFKTQSQWENHEKSKKHQATIARMRKELLLEGEEDLLDAPPTIPSQEEVDVDQFLEEQEILSMNFQDSEGNGRQTPNGQSMHPKQEEEDDDEKEGEEKGEEEDEQQKEEGDEEKGEGDEENVITDRKTTEKGRIESDEDEYISRAQQQVSSPSEPRGANKKQKKKLQKLKARKKIIQGSSSEDETPEPVISPVQDSSDEDTPKGGRKTRRRRRRIKD